MKKKNQANSNQFPFDVEKFKRENKVLINKYLRKNTDKLTIPDFDNVNADWYYQGNENILRGRLHLEDEYTVLQKLEWIKCKEKIEYFVEKYVRIISIDDGIIPFKLYDYQKKLIKLYNDNRFSISTMARQAGKTQTTAAFLLHYSLFNASKSVAILANKGAQAQEILERIQQSFEFLPMFLQGGVRTYNKRSMKLNNLSQIFCAATSSSSIRGKSISCVSGDTTITVRDKHTNKEMKVTLKELKLLLLENELNCDVVV